MDEILLQSPLFKGLKPEKLECVLQCLTYRVKHYQKDDIIFWEDDSISSLGIVLSGTVLITKSNFTGARTIVAEVQPANLFGESFALIPDAVSPVTTVAGDKTQVLFLKIATIMNTQMDTCPYRAKLVSNLLGIIAQKNFILNEKIEILSRRTIRERLFAFLYQESKKQKTNPIRIGFNRQELADYLCVDRSALSAEIGKLQKEGILSAHKNSFTIFDENSIGD